VYKGGSNVRAGFRAEMLSETTALALFGWCGGCAKGFETRQECGWSNGRLVAFRNAGGPPYIKYAFVTLD
jgi:hypothetical protein